MWNPSLTKIILHIFKYSPTKTQILYFQVVNYQDLDIIFSCIHLPKRRHHIVIYLFLEKYSKSLIDLVHSHDSGIFSWNIVILSISYDAYIYASLAV